MTKPMTTTGRTPTMRDDQREASRRRLVDAALSILAEEGYRGLTVKKVGERAGVSRGMVNYHFTSKAGLVEAVVHDIREVFVDRLRAVPGYQRMTGLEAVLAKLEQYFACLVQPGPSVRARALLVLLVEAVGTPADTAQEPLPAQLDRVRTGVEDDIRRGIADGSIRPDLDPRAQAFVLESLARGVLLQYQLDPSRARLEEIGRAAYDTVLLALAPRGKTG